ncbi:MAG: DUF4956 domain-containing protein [Deltaproteobacteria bacterium]|jgi:uncharacterized membrane protein YedE/YeeE|nr:DUF4956 domain-containing protein [Deltaproteobacteria bacterium]
MNKLATFEQFLAGQTPSVEMADFAINLILTFFLTLLISIIYVRFGNAISNRKMFSRNLILIALTTMLIITIVKSSLALSLGLVGALSIVRFRTPIKEPEELAYLFISIGVGLGLGAGQRAVTIIGCLFILAVIYLRQRRNRTDGEKGMHLSITSQKQGDDMLDNIIGVLKKYSDEVNLRRVDETGTAWQSDFFVSFSDYDNFSKAKFELRSLDSELNITFMDNHLL